VTGLCDWLIDPPRAFDPLPVVFHRRRVFILPTMYGYLFFGILLAMLLGSINYNNNLGFLLVFLLGSISLVSMIHTYRNLLGVRILSVSARPVFAGETAVFRFLVRAESGRRQAVGFLLEKERPVLEDIGEKTDETISVPRSAQDRGILRAGRLVVWTRYPLGLFRAWTIVRPDAACVVYPRPLAGPFQTSDGGQSQESADAAAETPGVDDFAGLKRYQPGDPLGRIAWKTLSRGMGTFTKEFTKAGGGSVMLDYDRLGDTGTEQKLSRLSDMVVKAHRMNLEYGLRLPGITLAPERGERQRHACLKALAVFGKKEA